METITQFEQPPASRRDELVSQQIKAIWCDLDRPMRETRQRIVQRYLQWLALSEDEARAEAQLFAEARQRLDEDDLFYLDEVERDVLLDGVTRQEASRLMMLSAYLLDLAS